MTCCVGALCDDRKAIVLVTDTMVGFGGGLIVSEADIGKALEIGDGWWALMAGNLSACELIVERLR